MIDHDRGSLFFGLILPHGILELTAVFVAAGVGLRLFWAWVDPGPRTRLQSVAHEGRSAGAVALGLVAGAAGQRGHRGVRDAVGPADLGPDRHRRAGGGAVLRLRVRASAGGPCCAGHTGDLSADRLEDTVAVADRRPPEAQSSPRPFSIR